MRKQAIATMRATAMKMRRRRRGTGVTGDQKADKRELGAAGRCRRQGLNGDGGSDGVVGAAVLASDGLGVCRGGGACCVGVGLFLGIYFS